ncbi:MAG: hypothetical protein R3B06_27945 [Kofleriaceae bacterium]
MIDEWMFKIDDDPKLRAQALAEDAESQRRSTVYPPGLHSDGDMWRIGSLRFWKAEACKFHRNADPFPTYIRGSLQTTLFPDMRLEAERFTTKDGQPATAIMLRSEKDPNGTFGTFSLDEHDAARIIAVLNVDMDEARKLATERFCARGGDPTAVASLRAPSPSERFRILDAILGDPDDQ